MHDAYYGEPDMILACGLAKDMVEPVGMHMYTYI